mmetsp:Transcript_44364/g.79598  ORF Transcript_44364/g.79598 Transcript_44364/m.79598 type:complete len:82 (+) Transcript_44364:707-952(+)
MPLPGKAIINAANCQSYHQCHRMPNYHGFPRPPKLSLSLMQFLAEAIINASKRRNNHQHRQPPELSSIPLPSEVTINVAAR